MKLVEVVQGLRTSQETLDSALDFVTRLKKTPVVVKDCPGFLVNRIFMPYVGEKFLAAQEGAVSPDELDGKMRAMRFPHGAA